MQIQLQSYAKRYLPQPFVDVLRMMKYRMDLATFPKRVVSHRYGRHNLHLNIYDRMAGEWYDKDWPPPPELEFLSRGQIPRTGIVFDLGAYQCLIAMLIARELVPDGSVVAVEANKHNVEIARRNLELNGVDNVDVVRGLISSAIGKAHADLSFNSRAKQGIDALVSEAVDAVSIDDLSGREGWPDLIYMDIEGFEIEALKGARETLTHWCHWFIELHGDNALSRYGARNADILKFFGIQDFARYVFLATQNKFRQVTESEPLPTERCFLIFAPRSARLINHASGQHAHRQ
jgi:FkbM family methyltransferase